MISVALTIAGSDPSGGAGLQADLKTFHQFGVYGMSVVTLLTVQNTESVYGLQVLDPEFVLRQLQAVVSDIPPAAAKTGALGNAGMIRSVAERLGDLNCPLVVDPVMISKHGDSLMDDHGVQALVDHLLPCATLATPNLAEAIRMSGMDINDSRSAAQAARAIQARGASSVLIKGVPASAPDMAVDLLLADNRFHQIRGPRFMTRHSHGSGCVLSAAIAALLARGVPLVPAVQKAKAFTGRGIETAPGLGRGRGPVNTFANPDVDTGPAS